MCAGQMALAQRGFVTARVARQVFRVDDFVRQPETWQRLLNRVSLEDPCLRCVVLVYSEALLCTVGLCHEPPVLVRRYSHFPDWSFDFWNRMVYRWRLMSSDRWVLVCIAQDVSRHTAGEVVYQVFDKCVITRDKKEIFI